MLLLICKEGDFYLEYKNKEFIEFKNYDKYKWLGLVYPFMCIFLNNLSKQTPALLMLSYDSKMRLQYKYNEYHIKASQESKIEYVKILIKNLKTAMIQLNKDLNNNNDKYTQILSLMALITYKTGIRIGKDIHFKNYNSIGLSTLMKKNLSFKSLKECKFDFIGKKGVKYTYILNDEKLNEKLYELYKKCKTSSEFIFKIENKKITYNDFNIYLKSIFKNDNISGKDFRTLLANVLFLNKFISNKNNISIEIKIRDSVKYVAENLQNTNAVSKKSYIFTTIISYILNNGIKKIQDLDPLEALMLIFNSVN